ncbi:MAG: hypothetical protein GKR91_17070 [Pseudomonadales bacterium]|nr:hypothetical protein [Pseudomonadales bacterium]
MRELTLNEVEEVSGGFGLPGAVIGGIGGGLSSAVSGGNVGQIIGSTLTGAVGGFFGGIAGATTGAARYMFGAYAIETGVIGTSINS